MLGFGDCGQRELRHPTPAARTFPTPQAAADALIDAAEKFDVPALEQIFGPDGKDIIHTGEPAHDQEIAKQFAEQARTKMDVSVDPKTKRRAFITVGNDDWPFPVPIVKTGTPGLSIRKRDLTKSFFAASAGMNWTRSRSVVDLSKRSTNTHETKHGDSHVNQYAQKIISTPGKQDGLAWQNPDGTWDGPVGENVARAIERGYSSQPSRTTATFSRVLKGQGPDAPLGQMDYVVNGAMIGGFALIAFPAEYRVTGVMTFMVSNDGVVYQKDLGPNTLEIARKLTALIRTRVGLRFRMRIQDTD